MMFLALCQEYKFVWWDFDVSIMAKKKLCSFFMT